MTDHPAAIAERAAVVAWMSKKVVQALGMGGTSARHVAETVSAFTRCIERGDHITQSGGRDA